MKSRSLLEKQQQGCERAHVPGINYEKTERVNVEAGEVYQELQVDDLGNRRWSDRLKV
jgi:hypothetical protein